MGFDIQHLVGKSVETIVKIGDEEAVVHYDPNVITKTRVENAEKGDEDFIEFFIALVVDWEVTEGGAPIPLTKEALEPLPIVLLRIVFIHILRESSSGDLGKVSSAPSRRRVPKDRMAKKPASRSGTGTSRSRAGSASPRGNS